MIPNKYNIIIILVVFFIGIFLGSIFVYKFVKNTIVEKERIVEVEKLVNKNVNVFVPDPLIEKRLKELNTENTLLQFEIKRIQKLVKVVPKYIIKSSVDGPVKGEPTKSKAPCFLTSEDRLRLSLDQVIMTTTLGNDVLVGTILAERVEGDKGIKLFQQVFHADILSSSNISMKKEEEKKHDWGTGIWAGASSSGWLFGLVLAAPSLTVPIINTSMEVNGFAGANVNGQILGGVQLIMRP
jgi:hypothetical protein